MTFQAKPLPWPPGSLVGFLTAADNQAHYDDHYLGYVRNLEKAKDVIAGRTLDQVMIEMVGQIANDAAQKWNHDFFWEGLTPSPEPIQGPILALFINQYDGFDQFKKIFEERVKTHFASGWIWLAWNPTIQMLEVIDGADAYNPLLDGYIPLLTLDVWEHAMLSYGTGAQKMAYVNNFWRYVNWAQVNRIIQENITGSPLFRS